MAEKGQVLLLPPSMHRMLDAGMQFIPRQRRLPHGRRGQASTPPKLYSALCDSHWCLPSSRLQQKTNPPRSIPQTIFRLCCHRTTVNPATPSMLIDPDAPGPFVHDQGLSWWGFRGLDAGVLESQICSPA